MIFTFLISIVFIAELIITIFILLGLWKLIQKTKNINETIDEIKPTLKDIGKLAHGISEQMLELSKDFVSKFSKKSEDIALRYLTKLLGMMLLWKLNSKTINKIRNSKISKLLDKGLSLIENMV